MIWIKNTSGRKDAILTMAWFGFLVVLLKVLLSGVTMEISGKNFVFGTIDGAVIAAILTPTLGAYVSRRYTETRYADKNEKKES